MNSQEANDAKRDIWNAEDYGHKVAPFVASLTQKIVAWLDPQPTGEVPQPFCLV